MTGVDTDLATLRECLHQYERAMGVLGWTMLNVNSHATLARVEAELSRLREQRDAAATALVDEIKVNGKLEAECARLQQERDELAEQGRIAAKRYGEEVERCARQQQALAEIRERCREGHGDDLIAVTADEHLAAMIPDADTGWRRAYRALCSWSSPLAGPDTPADSQPEEPTP